jgi:hypothetical protein
MYIMPTLHAPGTLSQQMMSRFNHLIPRGVVGILTVSAPIPMLKFFSNISYIGYISVATLHQRTTAIEK